jgi:hypothetical protein
MNLSSHEVPNMVGKNLIVNQEPQADFQDTKVVGMLYVRNVSSYFSGS